MEEQRSSGMSYPLAVVGCDFRVASSRWRSRLVLSPEEALELAEGLRRTAAADGFADLNTCNRTEWLVSTERPEWAVELLRAQMQQRISSQPAPWFQPYAFFGEEAAEHVLRVAVGLESLVVGERQIAGQLYLALEEARERGTSSRVLNGLGAAAGRLVRAALKRGCLSGSGVGVHNLAVRYARHHLGDAVPLQLLVVGLGSIGRQVANLLEASPDLDVRLCNRTVSTGNDRVHQLSELPVLLCEVDAAIVCTGAPRPVLDAALLRKAAPARPLLLVDIGIPEQVERENVPAGVTVAGLDELTAFHLGRRIDDLRPVCACEREVDFSLGEFRAFCAQPAYAEILDTVHRHHGQLMREELPRAVAAVPDDVRGKVADELRAHIRDYTTEVLRSIRSQTESESKR